MDSKQTRRFFGWIVFALALAAAPAVAERGAIPLWEPTVISQPGKYVLTRNISGGAAGPVLDIQADGEVFIDGNGFEVSSSDMTQPVVRVGTGAPYGVTIQHLRVRGGLHGIADGGGAGGVATCWIEVADVIVSAFADTGIKANTGSLEARGIIIVEGLVGFDLGGPADGTPGSASIRESTIRADHGIHCTGLTCNVVDSTVSSCISALILDGAEGSQAEQSQFSVPGSTVCFNPQPEPPGPAIQINNSPNTVIAYSTLTGPSATGDANYGVLVDAMSDGSNITDNWIRGFGDDGIHMLSDDSTVHCNVVSGNFRHGVFLGGFNNVAEDNKVGGNSSGDGLHFATSGHVYRANVLLNNLNPIGGTGAADAIDGGGNIQ